MNSQSEVEATLFRHGDHVAVVCRDTTEEAEALLPVVRAGLDRDERCACTIEDQVAEQLCAGLSAFGVEVSRQVQRGALAFLAKPHTLHEMAPRKGQGILDHLRQVTEHASAEGFSGLRVISDMSWALGPGSGEDRLAEVETALRGFLPGARAMAFCLYNQSRLGAGVVAEALRFHPLVLHEGRLYPNPFYEPPEAASGPGTDRLALMLAQLQRSREAGEMRSQSVRVGTPTARPVRGLLFRADRDGTVLEYRVAGTAPSDEPEGALVGHPVADLFPSTVGSQLQRAVRDVVEGSAMVGLEYSWLNGGPERFFNATLFPMAGGQVMGVVRDVSDRRLAESARRRGEEALQESEERLRLALANSPDVMFYQDRDLRYTWVVNPVVRPSPEAVVGRSDFDLLPAEVARELTNAKRRVLETGVASSMEIRLEVAGADRYMDLALRPRRDPEGRIVGIAGYGRDITQRKLLEEQTLRVQRLESVARMAGQVAHDFNSLLAPLAAYPGLIKAKLPPGHPAARYCDAMVEAAQRMAAINADMMALGAGGRPQREAVDLNELVRSVVSLVPDPPETLTLEPDLAAAPIYVWGSPPQLLRVVSNLLSNAREAMGDVGTVRITGEAVYIDRPVAGQDRIGIGEYAKLSVSDGGCGIPPEIRDRIFDAFFTTKRGLKRSGFGLGLTIVQAIVWDHGGHVDLDSEVGKGSTFVIYLPISRDAPVESPAGSLRGGSEAVLVVDDDDLQLRVVREMLARLGYRVETVRSGEEAVAHLAEHRVDLLILDMIMPDGMDGAETYRRIVQWSPGQRALILSGNSESDLVHEAQALGAGAYIRKPVTLERLAQAVREELDRRSSPAAGAGRSPE